MNEIITNERINKRFNKLLINTRAIYWNVLDEDKYGYIGRLQEYLENDFFNKKEKKWFRELLDIIREFNISNEMIHAHINTMDNPRKKWNERMREHNKGGYETRDNKGQFVEKTTTYHTPNRYENGNIKHCNFNKIRYPKKARSKRTWKQFYKMFPKQAVIDNWDGNTSDKMK